MKENKTARLELRLRQADKERILKAAALCGLSASGYVLQCCSRKEPRVRPPDEFWNLLNELYTVFDELSPEKQEILAKLILRLQETA